MTNETRREKFKRLATNRTRNAINQLRLLGNLSNKANYDYQDEDVRKVFKAVDDQIKTTKSKFRIEKNKEFNL